MLPLRSTPDTPLFFLGANRVRRQYRCSDGGRISLDYAQIEPRDMIGGAAALFPVLECPQTEIERIRELGLAEPQASAQRDNRTRSEGACERPFGKRLRVGIGARGPIDLGIGHPL